MLQWHNTLMIIYGRRAIEDRAESESKLFRYLFLILLIVILCPLVSYSQGFSGIIPLQSNCEDVKRVLKVEKCTFPQSIYRLKDFSVSIGFTKNENSKKGKVCYKVASGTVSSVKVSYYKPFPLSEFEYKLDYSEGPFGDTLTTTYANKEKGVTVFANNEFVRSVIYLPTEKDYQLHSFPCNLPDTKSSVDFPYNWFDRYWNLSPTNERKRLNQVINELRNSDSETSIYFVYYYNCKEDRELGASQTKRAKKYLELKRTNSNRIKVVDGGYKEKSEVVVYVTNMNQGQKQTKKVSFPK